MDRDQTNSHPSPFPNHHCTCQPPPPARGCVSRGASSGGARRTVLVKSRKDKTIICKENLGKMMYLHKILLSVAGTGLLWYLPTYLGR